MKTLNNLPKTHTKCAICKRKLPNTKEYFYFRKDRNKERINNWCKKCTKEQHFIKTYGITQFERNNLYIKQDGCCKICNRPFELSNLGIDHNHKTNKIRALLCVFCNTLVGYLEKRPDHADKAINYIEAFNE